MKKKKIAPPVRTFRSDAGRAFVVAYGERNERSKDDPLWSEVWPILFEGKPAGQLFRSLQYGTTRAGSPRWHASTRELLWSKAADAPTGVGFDVAAFDSAERALARWSHSADEILDWAEGKPVKSVYSKTGVFQKKAAQ